MIISWYENSSRSVTWITPSKTSTLPYCADRNTMTSWKSLRPRKSTSSIFKLIACPGHISSLTSLNQPFITDSSHDAFAVGTAGRSAGWGRGWKE